MPGVTISKKEDEKNVLTVMGTSLAEEARLDMN
jgi:hypothetical protein